MLSLAFLSLAMFGAVTCSPAITDASRQCTNMTIPVTLAARNGFFNVTTLADNLDATSFIMNLTSIRGNFTEQSLVNYTDETGTYNITAQYCASYLSNTSTLLFLTHGIGFDKS